MCELFGFTGKQKENLGPMLREFFSHSISHPNGWGLAKLDEQEPQIEKEAIRASDSHHLHDLLSDEILGQTLLGHIRKATIGSVSWKNCHPYTQKDVSGRTWTLVHNGTIFDYPPLSSFYGQAEGDTDSACILAYLVSAINTAIGNTEQPLRVLDRFRVVEKIISEMARGNKLNLLIFDGDVLYVHTNMAGTLYHRQTPTGTVFATVPLDDHVWEKVPMTRLLAYSHGIEILEGENHGHVYEETAEHRKALSLNYLVY